ncbi:MAG: hypothetical protein HY855_06575 [Burkholderiales bacterium]|nr:hypothetical protein [Burkholderiales bacterium]
MDGYDVSCDQRWLAVWGKPRTLNPDNPQDSNLTIVDLQDPRVTPALGFERGIFGVEYLKTPARAIVATDSGALLDLERRVRLAPPAQFDFGDPAYLRESCAPFPNKTYRRYPP